VCGVCVCVGVCVWCVCVCVVCVCVCISGLIFFLKGSKYLIKIHVLRRL